MGTIRTHKEPGSFFIAHKRAVEDNRLSWKAKGIHTYLMSKPNDWVMRMSDLCNHATDGDWAVRSGLEELERHGYLVRRREHDVETGHFDWVSTVYETPVAENERSSPEDRQHSPDAKTRMHSPPVPPVMGNPQLGNPQLGNPQLGNQQGTNNDYTNNECSDNECSDNEKNCCADAQAKSLENERSRSEFRRLFGEGPTPPEKTPSHSARALCTQEGRDAIRDRVHREWHQRQANDDTMDLERESRVFESYRPGVDIDRGKVLKFIQNMREKNVSLNMQNRSEVRYWIRETEGLLQKVDWDLRLADAVLRKAMGDNISIKSPASIHYAVSDVLRQRNNSNSSVLSTPVRKIKAPPPEQRSNA